MPLNKISFLPVDFFRWGDTKDVFLSEFWFTEYANDLVEILNTLLECEITFIAEWSPFIC